MTKIAIEIREVSKKYKENAYFSIDHIDLKIEKGAFFGFLGPNGAGKTTLISILCGLLKPTSGSVLIKGLNYQQHEKQLKQRIGVVPQEYALYPTLTAYENLVFFGSMYGLKGKTLSDRIHQYLEILGLLAFKNKRIETYSGGMKRRINLIAGILHNPDLLFLDEPTVGVDLQSRLTIVSFLKELHRQGTTIIYTSHHLHEIQELCTAIAVLDKGKLFALGTSEELMKQTGTANLEAAFLSLTGTNLRDYV